MNENDLAVALCLLMAQQNYCVVYKETQKSHLKLVGKLSDQCQDTLVQFGTFLGSTLTVEEYINKLPTIQSMLLDYHIPTEVAFFLARPMFNHSINVSIGIENNSYKIVFFNSSILLFLCMFCLL